MATNILMPALSPTMTEGTLARWLKKEGETVATGDVIAEIETDKATMEVEAADEGRLAWILVPAGTEGVAVNTPIAVLAGEGEDPTPPAVVPVQTSPVHPAAQSPGKGAAEPVRHPDQNTPPPGFASPLARRLARQGGVDLAALRGTGPHGRIVRADVERALTAAAAPARTLPPIEAPHELVPHSTMRRTIARRLTEAKATIPHFYLIADIRLDAALGLRADLNARAPEGKGAFRLSVNDLILKACAIALERVPGVNAAWTDGGIARYRDIDISVAVAIPDGLITPVLRDAGAKSLVGISNEFRALAERARAGKLKPHEFQGGGFSISNLGMHGVRDFAAIINPPQAAILAVGAAEKRAVVIGDALAVGTVMTCTLSVDHRVIDGALGAEFLDCVRTMLEDPLSLLL